MGTLLLMAQWGFAWDNYIWTSNWNSSKFWQGFVSMLSDDINQAKVARTQQTPFSGLLQDKISLLVKYWTQHSVIKGTQKQNWAFKTFTDVWAKIHKSSQIHILSPDHIFRTWNEKVMFKMCVFSSAFLSFERTFSIFSAVIHFNMKKTTKIVMIFYVARGMYSPNHFSFPFC